MDPASAGVPAMAVFPAIEIVFEFAERFTRADCGKASGTGVSVQTPAAYRSVNTGKMPALWKY
jgi:hypothetical protein